MTDNDDLHVVYGTGAVGMAVMDTLVQNGRRVRMVNRSGRASVPESVEVVGGDAADPTFTRAASAGARLIAIENLYMYGLTGGRPLTEDLPYAPNTRKGTIRARMSEELMEAHTSGRVQVAIGRASDFFGPR